MDFLWILPLLVFIILTVVTVIFGILAILIICHTIDLEDIKALLICSLYGYGIPSLVLAIIFALVF